MYGDLLLSHFVVCCPYIASSIAPTALLVRTMGYEPDEYSENEKLWLLCRLIPIVHNRVNMMELAPPGSASP